MSLFLNVSMGPADPILGVAQRASLDENAIDVSIGAYRDENGCSVVFEAVKEAENMILSDINRVKDYLPITGNPAFVEATRELCFGDDCLAVKEKRIATVQSLSGTGALRVGAEFLNTYYSSDAKVYLPKPTWGNHKKIFGNAGFELEDYTYWDDAAHCLDFEGMKRDINVAPSGSIIVLHVCAQNPTGSDPTHANWNELLEVIVAKKTRMFFDSAYQGFATGDIENDAYPVRLFAQKNVELLIAQSYSKNMGLYGERIGALNVVCNTEEIKDKVLSRLKMVIRAQYSNPPRHGAAIAQLLISNKELRKKWLTQLDKIVSRVTLMRKKLREALEAANVPGDWSYITSQIGMFIYTNLTPEQVKRLEEEFSIYMPSNGRISVSSVTDCSIPRLVSGIKSVIAA